jgi:hypothetical protein
MKFTLLAYESTLVHVAGYLPTHNAEEFTQRLTKLVEDFSAKSGVPTSEVQWEDVLNSDWCRRMVVLWAKVPQDWKPTEGTFVLDESYMENWHPNSSRSLSCFLEGRGKYLDIRKHPPVTPHNLFRTVIRK